MNYSKMKHCFSDKVYFAISGVFLGFLFIVVLYPLIFVLSASFSSGDAVSSGKVILFPVDFSLEGYEAVFNKPDIWQSYFNTIFYTVTGTLINVAMVMIAAYPLSRQNLKGKNVIMFIFTFTMFFSGGMIPFYMLLADLKFMNTVFAMIIPGALSVYNMIIARTFIKSNIPNEIYEAATIDGCNDTTFFYVMVLPLSTALIAVIALFASVGHWNAYFGAMMYLSDRALMPLQIILREILIMNQIDLTMVSDPEMLLAMAGLADVLKYSLIVVATLPILCVYPFAQKYFVKGVMIGSVKG